MKWAPIAVAAGVAAAASCIDFDDAQLAFCQNNPICIDGGLVPQWSVRAGGTGSKTVQSMVLSPNSVLLAGSYSGAADFGTGVGMPTAATLSNGYLASWAADGGSPWAVAMDGTIDEQALAVTYTGQNSTVHVGGMFTSLAATIGDAGVARTGVKDGFVGHYSPSGIQTAPAQVFRGGLANTNVDVRALAARPNSSTVLLAVGYRAFDAGIINEPPIDAGSVAPAMYVGEMTGAAHTQYLVARCFTPNGQVVPEQIAADSTDLNAVYVLARYTGTCDFTIGNVKVGSVGMSLASDAMFVARVSKTGPSITWIADFPAINLATNKRPGLVSDQDEVVVVATFKGQFNGPNGAILPHGGNKSDGAVIRLDRGDGHPLWATRLGGSQDDDALAVAVDPGTDIWVTGSFQDTADFGTFQATSAGGIDAYVARFSATGTPKGVFRFGNQQHDQFGAALAFDSNNRLFWAGQFSGTINFGAGDLTASGQDLFLVRFGQ